MRATKGRTFQMRYYTLINVIATEITDTQGDTVCLYNTER